VVASAPFVAVADQQNPDGDTATTGGNITYGPGARACDTRGSAVNGAIAVKYTGSSHLTAGENLSVSFSTPTGVSAAVTGTPTTPSTWNSSSPDFTIPFTTTVGTAAASGTVNVTVRGATSGHVLSGQPSYGVAISCPTNTAPVAVNDSYGTDEDTPISVSAPGVLSNDTDADSNALTAALVSGPANAASFSLNANGSFNYTPSANFNGTDSFTYKANDGTVDSASPATVTITVGAVNDAPAANDDSATTDEDTAVAVDVLANDNDVDGNSLTAGSITTTASTHGTASVIASGPDAGKILYTPAADYNGPASFSYRANDGSANSNEATVSITVVAVNDAPVAADDSTSTTEDNAVDVDVLANDTDADGDTLSVVEASLSGTNGIASLNGDGTVKFTPDANYYGTGASFTYSVSDGTAQSAAATVNVTVTPVNDAPVADNETATTDEDNAVDVDVLTGDTDVDGDTLSISSVGAPSNGTATVESGQVRYTPNGDFFGSDSFTVTICDDHATTSADDQLCDTSTVNVTVNPVNDAPVADDETPTVAEDGSELVDVLDGDSDVDAGDTLSISSVSDPANGSAAIESGKVRYTPDADFYGSDSFTYQVCDDGSTTPASGDEKCDTGTVYVTVTAVNDAPVVTAGSGQTTNEGSSVSVDATFTDVDQAMGETYTASINWGDGHTTAGTVTGNSVSGSHTYVDDEPGAADDDFTVTITVTDSGTTNGSADAKSGSDTLTVHVNNVAPSVAAPSLSVNSVTGVLSLSTTFSDPAGTNDSYDGKFVVDGADVAGNISGTSMTGSVTLDPGCHTIEAVAQVSDHDGGVGDSDATTRTVDVYTASFMAPIRDDVRNLAKYGNVVPVKVQLGSNCSPGTTVTTESLYLTIVQGDATQDDTVNDDTVVVATSVSNADTGTQMRVSDGKYIYNLSTKTMTMGKDYTIRVRSGSATGPIILRALIMTKK
jgi:hypothetical protein